MELRDDDLDAFIKTATGGEVPRHDAAEQRRRYRAAFAALPQLRAPAVEVIRRKRVAAESPERDAHPGIEMLRGWLRRIHMELVDGWDQDTSQEQLAVLLGEYPRGHARAFRVALSADRRYPR